MIPARYQSSRFPGKPLVKIAGKPMIIRTWEQAMKASKLDKVVVATDDERIAAICKEYNADVVMTDEAIANGTERCAQALERLGGKYDICVNIQGDEPLIEPEIIDKVVVALQEAKDAVYRYTEAHHLQGRRRVKKVTRSLAKRKTPQKGGGREGVKRKRWRVMGEKVERERG